MTLPLIVLVGPTATGKSALAIEVARVLAERGRVAEVVNGDSMLVYRGMDIGTAKPTPAERAEIAHHLIDIQDVTEPATVAQFQRLARTAIADVRSRGDVPILVGGSALYTRAVVDHFDFQPFDPSVRARWEAELERAGAEELHRRLVEVAPTSALHIEPGNGRRIVRALEVAELTGGHVPTLPKWEYELADVHQFGLELDRALLDARIDSRVDAMFESGLVAEVERLCQLGLREGLTAPRAIGYRQVIDFLDGASSEQEAVQAVKKATRRFVRKQLSWYRRDPRIRWLAAGDPGNADRIAAAVGLCEPGKGAEDAAAHIPQGPGDPQ